MSLRTPTRRPISSFVLVAFKVFLLRTLIVCCFGVRVLRLITRGVLPEKLGWGVRSALKNPYPI